MKELSIEEKAIAYDEAIEKARKINSGEGIPAPPDWTICEVLFPELKESEDEKIRKELISFLQLPHLQFVGERKQERWLAWLEKQGQVKESTISHEENERIRKAISQCVEDMRGQFEKLYSVHHKDAIAWLEKQGEQKSVNWNELTWEDINDLETIMNEVHSDFRNGIGQKSFGLEVLERFLYNKDYEHLDIKSPKFKDGDEIRSIDGQYEDTVLEVLSDGSYRLKNLGLLSIPENEWELVNAPVNGYELIDKKEQEGFLTTKNTQKVLSQQLEKQSEKKLADKVEPKFKVGDWIACDELNTALIVNIDDDRYEVEFIDGNKGFPHTDYIDRNFHLWTIQDAKDGDVLVHNGITFIFKGIEDGIVKGLCSELSDSILNFGEPEYDKDYYPATKEQRDLLFQKMKEAGYEWDAEKKELKKINSYCQENCKGFQETGKCFADGECKAKREAEQKPTDEEMKTLLRTEYEKGRADAIAEMNNPAWSEEDEEELDIAISTLKEAGQHDSAKWLKFLKDRVQPKQEWSEEDEKRLKSCLNILQAKGIMGVTETINTKWLKSLRPQNRWKPSDEQMKALRDLNLTGNISYAGQGQVLIELYNDLKKLAEE